MNVPGSVFVQPLATGIEFPLAIVITTVPKAATAGAIAIGHAFVRAVEDASTVGPPPAARLQGPHGRDADRCPEPRHQVSGDDIARKVVREKNDRIAERDRVERSESGDPSAPAAGGHQDEAQHQRHRRGGVAARIGVNGVDLHPEHHGIVARHERLEQLGAQRWHRRGATPWPQAALDGEHAPRPRLDRARPAGTARVRRCS